MNTDKTAFFLNLKKGDIILTGRFKNSPKPVKEFGSDAKGQPTVNGSPMLNFRIKNLMPKKDTKKASTLLPIEERMIR